jgi:hypothetical protein
MNIKKQRKKRETDHYTLLFQRLQNWTAESKGTLCHIVKRDGALGTQSVKYFGEKMSNSGPDSTLLHLEEGQTTDSIMLRSSEIYLH